MAAAQDGAPDWQRPASLADFWPQGRELLGTGEPCPFLNQRRDGGTASLTVAYGSEERHGGEYAIHLQYSGVPDTSAGWGIGCLRYDAGLFSYIRFWLKGTVGQRFQFRLKDTKGREGTAVDLAVKEAGWHRIIMPIADFRGIDHHSVAAITFSFVDRFGPADIYIDDFEFLTRPESDGPPTP